MSKIDTPSPMPPDDDALPAGPDSILTDYLDLTRSPALPAGSDADVPLYQEPLMPLPVLQGASDIRDQLRKTAEFPLRARTTPEPTPLGDAPPSPRTPSSPYTSGSAPVDHPFIPAFPPAHVAELHPASRTKSEPMSSQATPEALFARTLQLSGGTVGFAPNVRDSDGIAEVGYVSNNYDRIMSQFTQIESIQKSLQELEEHLTRLGFSASGEQDFPIAKRIDALYHGVTITAFFRPKDDQTPELHCFLQYYPDRKVWAVTIESSEPHIPRRHDNLKRETLTAAFLSMYYEINLAWMSARARERASQ